MSKTVVSFDIGIKNLAYCVFTLDSSSIVVRDWGVINLSDPQVVAAAANQGPLCNCPKVKSGLCGKKATFFLGTNYYCNVHSKNCGKLLPNKETSMTTIKKLKMDDLIQFCKTHSISIENKDKKPEILQKAQALFLEEI